MSRETSQEAKFLKRTALWREAYYTHLPDLTNFKILM